MSLDIKDWKRRDEPSHEIYELWVADKAVAFIQVFANGSAGYWFELMEKGRPASSFEEALRLVDLHLKKTKL
jgi:hypothetical protein